MATLRAVIAAGTLKEAAADLDVTVNCIQRRLARLRHRNGMTLPQLAYWLDRKAA